MAVDGRPLVIFPARAIAPKHEYVFPHCSGRVIDPSGTALQMDGPIHGIKLIVFKLDSRDRLKCCLNYNKMSLQLNAIQTLI